MQDLLILRDSISRRTGRSTYVRDVLRAERLLTRVPKNWDLGLIIPSWREGLIRHPMSVARIRSRSAVCRRGGKVDKLGSSRSQAARMERGVRVCVCEIAGINEYVHCFLAAPRGGEGRGVRTECLAHDEGGGSSAEIKTVQKKKSWTPDFQTSMNQPRPKFGPFGQRHARCSDPVDNLGGCPWMRLKTTPKLRRGWIETATLDAHGAKKRPRRRR